MGDVFDDIVSAGTEKLADAAKRSGSPIGDVAASAIGGAAKGAAIGTTVSQAITWGSIGTAAAIAAAAPTTAGIAAAGTAIGAGAAIGNAIPIPGVGAAIGAIVGALIALGNAFKGPDFFYLARTPKDAKLILSLIRVSPTFLPHLVAVMFADGKGDPAAVAKAGAEFWRGIGKDDPTRAILVDLARRMGGLKGDSGKAFDETLLYGVVKALKLLAHEVPGVKFKGPVIIPGYWMGYMPDRSAPDADAWTENDGAALKYLNAQGSWDYKRWDGVVPSPMRLLFGHEPKPDKLLDKSYLKSVIRAWAEGNDLAPVVKGQKSAKRVLGVLRDNLPDSLAIGRERGEAANIDLRPLQDEIKSLRRLAGESGHDKKLSSIFGDVDVSPPAPAKPSTVIGVSPAPAGSKAPLFVAGGLVLAAVLGGGGYAVWRHGKKR